MNRGASSGRRSKEEFEELYDRAATRLLVYLARRMHDLDAATELWAECWAVAFECWPRCRAGTASEAEAWAFGIARNQLAGYYRSGAIRRRALERLKWTVPELDTGEHEELERIAELDLMRARLGEALAELSDKRRVAVQLRVVAGLSYSEVAARMGCSEQTARAHVSRGLRRLAGALDAADRTGLEGAAR
jgi:RNA polymerase sigma-70 factor (ECF subfamily)